MRKCLSGSHIYIECLKRHSRDGTKLWVPYMWGFFLLETEAEKERERAVTYLTTLSVVNDCLCGLVVRVSGYRYRGSGFDPRHYQIFCVVVGLEWGPLSLVRSIEELLE